MNEQLKLGNLRLAVENDDCAMLKNLLHEVEVDVNYTFRFVIELDSLKQLSVRDQPKNRHYTRLKTLCP